jgi:hypothetical protein
MATPGKKPPARPGRRLKAEQRRALQMLASSGPSGATEAILLAHGFSDELLDGIARLGLVVVTTGTVRAGERTLSVRRLRITEVGRKAIGDA